MTGTPDLDVKGGVHQKVVQAHLGHGSVAVTLDIYSHVTPEMDQEAAERVATMFRPVENGRRACAIERTTSKETPD